MKALEGLSKVFLEEKGGCTALGAGTLPWNCEVEPEGLPRTQGPVNAGGG